MAEIFKRTTISLDKTTSDRVDDFRYTKRIDNQNTALILIIRAGLDAVAAKENAMAGLPQKEKDLLAAYSSASEQKKKIIEFVLTIDTDDEEAKDIRRQIDAQTKKGPET